MILLDNIHFDVVLYTWLKTEWYLKQYDNVRSVIDINELNPDDYFDARMIQALIRFDRGKMIDSLPKNIKWWYALIEPEEFSTLNRIGGGGWDKEFGDDRNIGSIINGLCGESISAPHRDKIVELYKRIGYDKFEEQVILVKRKEQKVPVILDGNHRAISFLWHYRNHKTPLPNIVIIGIEQ